MRYNRQLVNYSTTLLVLVLFFWSASAVQLEHMAAGGLQIAGNIIRGLLYPDLSLLFNLSTKGVAYLLLETMAIAFLGTIIGGILALPFAFLSASNIVPKPISIVVKLFLIIVRTVPAIVYGIMFVRVTGFGPFTGVLTMSLTSIGMLSKLYVDVIEEMDTSVLEALESIGCNTFEKIRYGIVPQLTAMFLSIVIYRYDMNVRDAAILGLVGAGGIGAPLIFAMNAYRWNEAGSILIGLMALIFIIEYLSNKFRAKLVGHS